MGLTSGRDSAVTSQLLVQVHLNINVANAEALAAAGEIEDVLDNLLRRFLNGLVHSALDIGVGGEIVVLHHTQQVFRVQKTNISVIKTQKNAKYCAKPKILVSANLTNKHIYATFSVGEK